MTATGKKQNKVVRSTGQQRIYYYRNNKKKRTTPLKCVESPTISSEPCRIK